MKTMKRFLCGAMLLIATVISGSCLTSCNSDDNNAKSEMTLEDALKNESIVALTFNVNGEDYYVAFVRVGDTYELLDYDKVAWTRGDEPAISEKNCDFSMEHDKANNLLKFYVNEKKTSKLIFAAIFDIKESTMEVIPGDPKYKVTGVKMKVSNVEITKLLKEKGEGVTLTDALVKGAKVVIVHKWNNNNTTTYTFTNNGGSFSGTIEGDFAQDFDTFLKPEGNELFFSTKDKDWFSTECNLEIKFNIVKNTYKFWTVTHSVYNSFTISVNGTDITSTLKEERL